MRKLIATACLCLLLLGCENSFREEASFEGVTTSGWIEQLKDGDLDQRRRAAEVLGVLGPTEADETVPALAGALTDPDAHVRLMALKSLEKLAPKAKKAQVAVGKAMNDKNKIIVKQALRTYKAIEMAKPSPLNNNQ
jgi:HEAT repeat protein